MTEDEKQLWEKRIGLAAAERRYRLACQTPASSFRELEAMLADIERMRADAETQNSKRQQLN